MWRQRRKMKAVEMMRVCTTEVGPWMVVLGCFVNYAVLTGYLKSSGVLFVELLRKFQGTASHAALLFGLRGAIFSVTGLYVMNVIVARLGVRKTVLIGAVLLALSAILSSFANDLTSLICIQSLLLGTADAMLLTPGEVLMGSYFRRRRSLAIAVAKCGASVGSVAVPPLMAYLLAEYDLRGALLLMGGLCLHSLPATLLLRPVSHLTRNRKRNSGNAVSLSYQNSSAPAHVRQYSKQTATVSTLEKQTSLQILPFFSDRRQAERLGHVGKDSKSHADDFHVLKESANESSKQSIGDVCNDKEACSCDRVVFADEINVSQTPWSSCNSGNYPQGTRNTLLDDTRASNKTCSEISSNHPERWNSESKVSPQTERKTSSNGGDNPEVTKNTLLCMRTSEKTFSQVRHANGKHKRRTSSESDVSPKTKEKTPCNVGNNSDGTKNTLLHVCTSQETCSEVRRPNGNHQERTADAESDVSPENGEKATRTTTTCCHRNHSDDSCAKRFLTCLVRPLLMLDFSLFHRPLFRLLVLFFACSTVVNITVDYLPAIATEQGVSEQQAALLLSVIGGLDFVCRLATGFIADLRKIRVSTMIIISCLILGLANQFVRFLTSFPLFLGLAVLQGMLGGVTHSLMPILIIEFVGLDNLGKGLGFLQLVSGAFVAGFFPLLGYIRDVTGSYVAVYHVIGSGILTAGALLSCEGLVKRCTTNSDENRTKRQNSAKI
ncbi:hypothetical protein BaRGS_00034539 [Batillaria attramentaria]|uniref:Major facilitator superfamily (MFS) profile domain-containing protein n=1 Tax=Batillaria attramentaria TaxID=370345 RepID=A0ABD0JHE9_9CAEN